QEAENVARVLGSLLSDSQGLSEHAQATIARLHEAQGRDVLVVDANQVVLADAVPADIGKVYTDGAQDEVGLALRDGQGRTFVEVSEDSPLPMKQMVVPSKDASGRIVGAVILEYTGLYDELMRATNVTSRHILVAGFGGVVIAVLVALYMGRSIGGPLRQLT